MKKMNEIVRFDENGNITKEWKEFVENLDREDLERFFIGADALCRRRKKAIDEASELLLGDQIDGTNEYDINVDKVVEAINLLKKVE